MEELRPLAQLGILHLPSSVWTFFSWPPGSCPFLLPALAPQSHIYGCTGPLSVPTLCLLRTEGVTNWLHLKLGYSIISGGSRYFQGESVTFFIPSDLFQGKRRNVKIMTQLFTVKDEENGKNPVNFMYSEKSFKIQKQSWCQLCWVALLLLWALYFLFVCFLLLVMLPSLSPSL